MTPEQSRTYDRASSVVFLKTDEPFGGLSNMAGGFPLRVNGMRILTSEALYQACRFPHRPEVQRLIIEQKSPMAAKMKSKPYRHESRGDWDQVRVKIMRWCLRVKLAQNWGRFSTLLLETGGRPIVEETRRDEFWGAKPTDDGRLIGMNVLGRLLMELREAIKAEGRAPVMDVPPPAISDFLLGGQPVEIVASQAGELDGESSELVITPRRGNADGCRGRQSSLFDERLVKEAPPAVYSAVGDKGMHVADLKPYSEYKESGSKWLGAVPVTWNVRNLRTLISKRAERDRADLPLLSVAREKGVFVRSLTDADENHNVIPEDLSNYKVARAGNLVINKMKAWQGSMGIAPCDGIVSPAYFVFDFRIANHTFGQRLLRSKPYVAHFGQASDGVRVGQWDLSIPGMRQIPVLVPPPDEQAAIVRFLDWANGRLERAIRAKREQLALVRERVLVETERALRGDGVVRKRLSTLAQLMSRPIDRRGDHIYTRIGLYNRGRGIFHKPAVPGTDLGDSEFFSVCPGDFVISGQFAWEGAVALARAKESGCIASHRYPILRGYDGIASSAFLFAFFRSSYGAMLLDYHSRGAAGRNRPLNAQRLLKEEIPVPSRAAQERIEFLLEQEYAVAHSVERMVGVINEYRTRLVADVVTGKLDVREAAARLPDEAPLDTVADDTDLGDEAETADDEAAL